MCPSWSHIFQFIYTAIPEVEEGTGVTNYTFKTMEYPVRSHKPSVFFKLSNTNGDKLSKNFSVLTWIHWRRVFFVVFLCVTIVQITTRWHWSHRWRCCNIWLWPPVTSDVSWQFRLQELQQSTQELDHLARLHIGCQQNKICFFHLTLHISHTMGSSNNSAETHFDV